MKKAIFSILAAIALCLVCGCKSNEKYYDGGAQDGTSTSLFGSFGDEHYVWESFFFSTNKVDEVK